MIRKSIQSMKAKALNPEKTKITWYKSDTDKGRICFKEVIEIIIVVVVVVIVIVIIIIINFY